MNIQKFNIIEADRMTSQKVKINGVSANNKASWVNNIKPINLKKGDVVNLETAIISQKGANSDSIEFSGDGFEELADNFLLTQIGFYLNHQGTNSLGIPFIDDLQPTNIKKTRYNDDRLDGDLIDNSYYSAEFYRYFDGEGYTNPNPADVYNIDSVKGINPYQTVDGAKYAKIKSNFLGWTRGADGTSGDLPVCELEVSNIPLNLKKGFLNPQNIANNITLQLQQTLPLKSDDPDFNSLIAPNTRRYMTDYGSITNPLPNEVLNEREIQFHMNGYCNITTTANLFTTDYANNNPTHHPIYNNLFVENPYRYVYGVNLIQNTDTYRLNEDPNTNTDSADPFFGNNFGATNKNRFTADYPVFLYSYYRNQPDNVNPPLDPDDPNNYKTYYPRNLSSVDSGGVGLTVINVKTSRLIKENIQYDRLYIQQQNTQLLSRCLVFINGVFRVVNQNSQMNIANYPTTYHNDTGPKNLYYIYFVLYPIFELMADFKDQYGNVVSVKNMNALTLNEPIMRIDGDGYSFRLRINNIRNLNGNIYDNTNTFNIGNWNYNKNTKKLTTNITDNAYVSNTTPTVLYPQKPEKLIECGWYAMTFPTWWGGHPNLEYFPDNIQFITQTSRNIPLIGLTGPELGTHNVDDETFTLTEKQNQITYKYHSRLRENQLIITNMKFNLKNIKIIEKFFKYNKIYDGNETDKNSIREDVENYYVNIDLGRTAPETSKTDFYLNQPVIAGYMEDNGVIGVNDSTTPDFGNINPRLNFHNSKYKQQVQIKCNYQEKYDDINYVVYEGVNNVDDDEELNYAYASLIVEDDKERLKEELEYIKNNNIGIIPLFTQGALKIVNGGDLVNYTIGFLVKKDYIDNELFAIQNHTYFGVSPSPLDIKQIVSMNHDNPAYAVFSGGPPYTQQNNLGDYCNYINVGATTPTLTFNTQFQKFQWSLLHTPVYQNKFNSSQDDVGDIVARLNDDKIIYKNYWMDHQPDGTALDNTKIITIRNSGINDTQCGIFLNNAYLQNKNQQTVILRPEDGVEINYENFYNSLFFKLGFTLYDLFPYKYSEDDFKNRFNDLYHNALINIKDRPLSLRPFTTNSDITINASTASNIYGLSSDYVSQAQFNLGYANQNRVALKVESAFMTATSIPVQISTAFYRIYTDLPIHTLKYQNDGSNLSCIGIALRNYSSSSFYYSYGVSYAGTITKDITITDIKTEIRNTNGKIADNISDNSTIIYKISSSQVLDQEQETPPDNPVLDVLEEIKGELQDRNEKIGLGERADNNIQDELRNDVDEYIEAQPNQQNQNRLIQNLINSLQVQIIQNLVSNTEIPASFLSKRGKPTPDDLNDAIRSMASGISQYFNDNYDKLFKVADIIAKKGRNAYNDKFVKDFMSELGKFRINADGKLVQDINPTPSLFKISRDGAEEILRNITNNPQLLENKSIQSKSSLTTNLVPLINDLLTKSNQLKLDMTDYGFDAVRVKYKTMSEAQAENLLRDPLPKFLKEGLDIDDSNIKKIRMSKNYRNFGDLYKRAQEEKDPERKYLLLRALTNNLQRLGVRVPSKQLLEVYGKRRAEPKGFLEFEEAQMTNPEAIRRFKKEGRENIRDIKKGKIDVMPKPDRRRKDIKEKEKLRAEEEQKRKVEEAKMKQTLIKSKL